MDTLPFDSIRSLRGLQLRRVLVPLPDTLPRMMIATRTATLLRPRACVAFRSFSKLDGNPDADVNANAGAETRTEAQSQVDTDANAELLYRGPLSKPIRVLKKVSVVTCASSAIAAPLLLYAGSETVPLAAQAAFSGLVLLAGWGSTGLLHYFTTGYVHALEAPRAAEDGADASTRGKPHDDDVILTAHLLTFFARPTMARFRVGATSPLVDHWNPLVSFDAELEGGGQKRLFVQGEHFQDKRLLRKLLRRPLDEDEMKYSEFDAPDWAKE